jgi:hypothetical protein
MESSSSAADPTAYVAFSYKCMRPKVPVYEALSYECMRLPASRRWSPHLWVLAIQLLSTLRHCVCGWVGEWVGGWVGVFVCVCIHMYICVCTCVCVCVCVCVCIIRLNEPDCYDATIFHEDCTRVPSHIYESYTCSGHTAAFHSSPLHT